MGFLFGIPRKLIKRVTEIEIDTHYYDTDVVPSSQDIFTYNIDKQAKIATVTGFKSNNIAGAVMPYRVKYGNDTSQMGANVTAIKAEAFKDNPYLIDMTIPNTIYVIPTKCFMNCTSLTRINISKSIKTIETLAFSGCTNLSSLFIPFTVTEIEKDAFKDCSNLKIICYKNSTAEKYAKENNIPYSLISYTLDDDITENSPNLVTSGVIYRHVTSLIKTITDHINDKFNPHSVTKTQIGLSEVDNTSDLNKPLSNAAINEFENTNEAITEQRNNLKQHINNKDNPHDSSTFNNTNLTGNTNMSNGFITNVDTSNNKSIVNVEYVKQMVSGNDVGNLDSDLSAAYQKRYDAELKTNTKTVVGAINELANNVQAVSGKLTSGWNTINLKRLYPISWKFLNKPYCYTDEGISVDHRIKDLFLIEDNCNAFNLYVPIDCNYSLSVTRHDVISGIPIDYLLLKYYYTGVDGKDLDTVTELANDWSLNRKTIGYGHQPDSPIKNNNGATLIQFSGDNRGGGTGNTNELFYECVYFDIKHLQDELPNEDVEIVLYGAWFEQVLNGHINVSLECYTADETPTVVDSGDMLSLKVNNNILVPNYVNNSSMEINIPAFLNKDLGAYKNYKNKYTPAFKIIFHKVIDGSNHRTISIQQLS